MKATTAVEDGRVLGSTLVSSVKGREGKDSGSNPPSAVGGWQSTKFDSLLVMLKERKATTAVRIRRVLLKERKAKTTVRIRRVLLEVGRVPSSTLGGVPAPMAQ